jgi:16S rRNA A1518/A1519 N6-dimethyltransferase RsmA/KsgA/DIM1 with predicted DNA glycosylase/AP lyase activity
MPARNKTEFKFGTCTVPDGKRGPWTIDTITLTKDDVMFMNLRALRDGNAYLACSPGTYKRLRHADRGTIMSNTPMEVRTSIDAYIGAKGAVLVNGLGLGMVLEGMLHKPEVTSIKVCEIDADLIALVGPHFKRDPRVTIEHVDADEYKPQREERYDYVWHDIWDAIDSENLPHMGKLLRKWARRAANQACWSRPQAQREKRRYG